MSRALPARREEEGLPPPVLILCAVSAYTVALSAYLLVLLCHALLVLQFPLALACGALLAVMFWAFAGVVIETGLIVNLLQNVRRQNYFSAERNYLRFTRLWRSLPVRKGGRLGLSYSNLALLYMVQGKYDAAEPVLREAVRLVERDRRLRRSYLMAIAVNNLAVVLVSSEQYEEAEELSKRALAIYEKRSKATCGPAFALLNLGAIAVHKSRLDEAERYLERAKSLLENSKKPFLIMPQSIEQAQVSCTLNFGMLRFAQGRNDEARQYCEQLLSGERVRCLRSTALETMSKLAASLLTIGDKALAERLLEQAYLIGQRQPDHLHTEQLLDTYALLLSQTGRADEVSDLRRWIRPVLLPAVIRADF